MAGPKVSFIWRSHIGLFLIQPPTRAVRLLRDAVTAPERNDSDTVSVYLLGSILNRTAPGENLPTEVCKDVYFNAFSSPIMLCAWLCCCISQDVIGVGNGVIAKSQDNEQVIMGSLKNKFYHFLVERCLI